jgi:hypothetical protein
MLDHMGGRCRQAPGTAVAFVCLLVYTIALTAATCIEAYFRAERKLSVVGLALGFEKWVLIAGAGGFALLGLGISAIAARAEWAQG